MEKNSLLSQSIAHFQKVHIQSQRQIQGQSGAEGDAEGRASTASAPHLTHVASSASGLSSVSSSAATAAAAGPGASASASTTTAGNVAPEASTEETEVEAEVLRRDEVCFEHARWRMTEADGQIGLADVELRGFLYARTHRRDDSGSHWLQLGSMRVRSLAPNSFYKEVLAPDCGSSYHHPGGRMIRVTCTQRPPVGGISVKEVMEISVAPLILQVSKPFYNQLMPFFFPERAAEEVASVQEQQQQQHADTAEAASDFVASSEDLLLETMESRNKRRNRLGGHIISRWDIKSWGGRLRPHSGRHHGHRQQRLRAGAAEEGAAEEGLSEPALSVDQQQCVFCSFFLLFTSKLNSALLSLDQITVVRLALLSIRRCYRFLSMSCGNELAQIRSSSTSKFRDFPFD